MSAICWLYQIFNFPVCINVIIQNNCLIFSGSDSMNVKTKENKGGQVIFGRNYLFKNEERYVGNFKLLWLTIGAVRKLHYHVFAYFWPSKYPCYHWLSFSLPTLNDNVINNQPKYPHPQYLTFFSRLFECDSLPILYFLILAKIWWL